MGMLDDFLGGGWPYIQARKYADRRANALDARMTARLQRRFRSSEERVAALESSIARVALLARSLAELGLAKGAFTREELERALLEADLADGASDGGLDPDVALPGEERAADLEPLDDGP